jgi:uncharacterized protein YutE (UPF0331/DUF86 family)
MTKRDLDSKIAQVKKYLAQAQRYSKITLKELEENDERRLAIERALFLVAQSSIDLAESYCRLKGFERPSSMHESIDMLKDKKVITSKLCQRLIMMVGFRNILTHGYSKIDYSKLLEVLRSGLKDIKDLLVALG